jgi:hypothetical protein
MRHRERRCIGRLGAEDLDEGLGCFAGRGSAFDAEAGVTVLFIVVGALGVAWILDDIFKQVLVPRAVEGGIRPSILFARTVWVVMRRAVARMPAGERRENLLGMFAPMILIALLGVWITGLALCYALMLYALRDGIHPIPKSFGETFFFAATTVVPIGSGMFSAVDWPARLVVVLAGASGIGTVAVAITFLYALIASFQERERFVVVLDGRAGAPPSGLALLETHASLGMMDDLAALFRTSENWAAGVLESHLAYPILMSFRSSHRDESWVAALGAVLDAAALLVTVVDGVPTGQARLMLDVGMHLTHDLDAFFDLPDTGCNVPTPSQKETICARLKAAGLTVRNDADRWEQFNALRESYAKPLEGIGRRWLHATAQVVGERTLLPGHGS